MDAAGIYGQVDRGRELTHHISLFRQCGGDYGACKAVAGALSERDTLERIVLRRAMEIDKSILGVCRGIQFINAALSEWVPVSTVDGTSSLGVGILS